MLGLILNYLIVCAIGFVGLSLWLDVWIDGGCVMDVIVFFGLDRDGNGLVCFVDVWLMVQFN